MHRPALLGIMLLLAPQAFADEAMKPGLWGQHVLSTVIDAGRKSQFADSMAAGQKQTRSLLGSTAANDPHYSRDGNVRECVSAERARHFEPSPQADQDCRTTSLHRDGPHLTMQTVCGSGPVSSKSTIDVVAASDLVRMRTDTTMTLPNGETHTVHTEVENRYVGSDCGALRPEPVQQPAADAAGK